MLSSVPKRGGKGGGIMDHAEKTADDKLKNIDNYYIL